MEEKKKLNTVQKVGLIFGAIIIFNFFQGIVTAIQNSDWNALYNKTSTLVVFGIILFFLRGYIKRGWQSVLQRREQARKDFEKRQGNINVKEAAIFSLAWSREIYSGIPEDRKHLVKTSFILIGAASGIMLLNLGDDNFLTFLLILGLIVAGVNLLIWVVGSERQEKDRIAFELETARKMQLSLMPEKDPEVRGFDISGCCIPALDVGGDLFDFVWTGKNQNKFCIPVADVSGKGMDAALTAVYTSGALVSETQHEENIQTVMNNLNSAILSRQNRSRFVSLLMTTIDLDDRRMDFINAGQSKPLIFKGGGVEVLKSEGARFPLGVIKTPKYVSNSIQFNVGDILLIFTDGVTEAMNNQEEMFGEERLSEFFNGLVTQQLSAKEMVSAIRDNVLSFSGPGQLHDDLTIVVVRAI